MSSTQRMSGTQMRKEPVTQVPTPATVDLKLGFLLQEIKTRPGRGLSNLDVPNLTELLREAEQHHGEYEPTAPKHHWSDWYAAYIVAREQGKAPEEAAKDGALHMEEVRR
jgi:hypothetical protein